MVRSTYLCQGSHRGDTASPGGKLWCVVVFEKPSKGLQETSQQAKDSSQHYWSHPSLAVTAMAHRELNTKPRERLYLIWLLLTSLLSSPVVSHRDLRPSHLSSPPLACPPPRRRHLCTIVSSPHLSLCTKVTISGRPFSNNPSKADKSLFIISCAGFVSFQGTQYLTFCYAYSLPPLLSI